MDIKDSKYVHSLKIVIIGEPGVGKTSFVKRFSTGKFTNTYKPTIGVDFIEERLEWKNNENTILKLQLWDVAGQERFGAVTNLFYRGADGALIVYDVTRPSTLVGAQTWKRDLERRANSDVRMPSILIANKSDLESKIKLGRENIDNICKEWSFDDFSIISVKDQPNSPQRVINRLIQIIDEKNSISELIKKGRKELENNGNIRIGNSRRPRPPHAPSLTEVCCGNPTRLQD